MAYWLSSGAKWSGLTSIPGRIVIVRSRSAILSAPFCMFGWGADDVSSVDLSAAQRPLEGSSASEQFYDSAFSIASNAASIASTRAPFLRSFQIMNTAPMISQTITM